MRIKAILAAAIAALAFGFAVPEAAEAGGLYRERAPVGWGRERTVTHHVYYPRYRHVYRYRRGTDPYAYRYEPRGYYPYYNSGYWRPAHEVRKRRRYRQAPYYQAWGYPKRGYRHREWHRRNHGRIRKGHW